MSDVMSTVSQSDVMSGVMSDVMSDVEVGLVGSTGALEPLLRRRLRSERRGSRPATLRSLQVDSTKTLVLGHFEFKLITRV